MGDWLFAPTPARETFMTADALSHKFRRLGRSAGAENPALHRIRHGVATHLVEKGKLLKAQARLGHRDRCPTPVRSQRPDEELECDRRGRTRTDAPIAVKQLFETL
jgi:site-specific recombinase XerD